MIERSTKHSHLDRTTLNWKTVLLYLSKWRNWKVIISKSDCGTLKSSCRFVSDTSVHSVTACRKRKGLLNFGSYLRYSTSRCFDSYMTWPLWSARNQNTHSSFPRPSTWTNSSTARGRMARSGSEQEPTSTISVECFCIEGQVHIMATMKHRSST